MRRSFAVIVLLYGLTLAANTTVPALIVLTGNRTVVDPGALSGEHDTARGDCSDPLGLPPHAGLYGTCPVYFVVNRETDFDGTVFGRDVRAAMKNPPADGYVVPGTTRYAALPPGPTDQILSVVAVFVITFGAVLLAVPSRWLRRRLDDPRRGTPALR
jgi:hypothetical protein